VALARKGAAVAGVGVVCRVSPAHVPAPGAAEGFPPQCLHEVLPLGANLPDGHQPLQCAFIMPTRSPKRPAAHGPEQSPVLLPRAPHLPLEHAPSQALRTDPPEPNRPRGQPMHFAKPPSEYVPALHLSHPPLLLRLLLKVPGGHGTQKLPDGVSLRWKPPRQPPPAGRPLIPRHPTRNATK